MRNNSRSSHSSTNTKNKRTNNPLQGSLDKENNQRMTNPKERNSNDNSSSSNQISIEEGLLFSDKNTVAAMTKNKRDKSPKGAAGTTSSDNLTKLK